MRCVCLIGTSSCGLTSCSLYGQRPCVKLTRRVTLFLANLGVTIRRVCGLSVRRLGEGGCAWCSQNGTSNVCALIDRRPVVSSCEASSQAEIPCRPKHIPKPIPYNALSAMCLAPISFSPCLHWAGFDMERYMTGFFFLEVFSADALAIRQMVLHIKTLNMDEEQAKADYVRHNKEVLAHVGADNVSDKNMLVPEAQFCSFFEHVLGQLCMSFMLSHRPAHIATESHCSASEGDDDGKDRPQQHKPHHRHQPVAVGCFALSTSPWFVR